jgi:uncharacterized Rmd1/YagE family protein
MAVPPASTDQLLEVGTRVDVLVVRVEVIQQLRRSVDASRSQTDVGFVRV